MQEQSAKRGGTVKMAALIAGIVLLMLMLYFLSLGPMEWLWQHGYIPEAAKPVVTTIYSPIRFLVRRLPMFAAIVNAYVQFWTRR